MLPKRSIFLQVCLLLTVTRCQDYEDGYDADESEDVHDDSGPVDYSKYYAVDTSAPLISAQDFGATAQQAVVQQPKNPFAAQTQSLGFLSDGEQFPAFFSSGKFPIDYFEAAQQSQKQENQESILSSGPDYISYNLPVTLHGEYSTGVEKVQKPSKQKKAKKNYDYDEERDSGSEYEYQPSESSRKYTDYNIGKSSSTVSQNPQATGYYEKLTQKPTPTPYQKYSFRPVTEQGSQTKFLDSLISTVAPFNPSYSKIASTPAPPVEGQPSDNIPKHLKENCKRVKKEIPSESEHSRRRRDAMNCFVCEDPQNGAKYTQCSYAEEPEPKNEYSGIAERYSSKPKREGDGFRYKRYSGKQTPDPYEYIKARSLQRSAEPEESREYEYKIPDFYTADDGIDRSFSEVHTEAMAKNPANCHKEESEGMTCTICKDPKTGGNFEQCSYTSQPKEQKYAYVTEKKYDSDEPEEGSEAKPNVQTKQVESTIKSSDKKDEDRKELPAEYKTSATHDNSKFLRKFEEFKPEELYKAGYGGPEKLKLSKQYNRDAKSDPTSKKEKYEPIRFQNGGKTRPSAPKKLIDDDPYQIPKHFAESTIQEKKTGLKGLEPSLYGGADSAEVEGGDADSSSEVEPYSDIDEYHFKLFPEFSNEESQQAEVVTDNPSADSTRKDVEEVLAEFTRKDRSACQKAEKNGMTCYLCVDKNGIQHEECMYVSESKPQASHMAYHEVKQIKSPTEDNKQKEQVPAATEIKRTYIKTTVTTPDPGEMQAAASNDYETKVKYNPNKNRKKNVKKATEPKASATNDDPDKLTEEESEPKLKATLEFVAGGEEGAFSAETKPVFSRTLGVKLPKYMLEKSEFEKEFDEFAGLSEE